MRAHLFAIAVIVLSVANTAPAEPPKARARDASQPAGQASPVLIAAADPVTGPSADNQQAQPQQSATDKPVRHARVTTCRCGDQNPSN